MAERIPEAQHWRYVASIRCDQARARCPRDFEAALAETIQEALLPEARRFLAGRSVRYGIEAQDLAQTGYLACQALLRGTSRFQAEIEVRVDALGCVCTPTDVPPPDQRLMTCLLVRVRSRWLDIFRKPWPDQVPMEEARHAADGHWADRIVELRQLRDRLDAGLPMLRRKEREVILADLRGDSLREVCDRLDISASYRRLIRHRAQQKLRGL